MDITTVITAAISGGALTQFVNFLNARRNAKKDDFSVIIEKWKEDNDRLRKEVDDMQTAHQQERKALLDDLERMRREISDLRSKVAIMEATAQSDIPAPMSLKDLQGRYLSVNRAWEEAFGLASHDVLGRTDVDIFGEKIGKELADNDRTVMTNGAFMYTAEEYGPDKTYLVLKYHKMAGTAKIGIGSVAFPAL